VSDRAEVGRALADAHRHDWAFVLAATARLVRDLDLAEECVQEAYADAIRAWERDGVPANPGAWLTTAAHRRGVDAVRRSETLRTKLPLLVEPEHLDEEADAPVHVLDEEEPVVRDERLRLVLLCCHPALAPDARVALTLRLVCGLSTPDIAAAFLVSEATMAARITRAKRRIAGSRIPFRMVGPDELPDRLPHVLEVVHLLFTTGHTAPAGGALVRVDLVDESVRLARMLVELLPAEPEPRGLLALLLATDARRGTRVDADGRLLTSAEQDRGRWDRDAIREAGRLVRSALPDPRAGRYALQAAIATLHAEAPTAEATDWVQLLGLYDHLLVVWPSPVVALNRLVPLAEVVGPEQALVELTALERDARLSGYRYLPAVRADLLLRTGDRSGAADALRAALDRTANEVERAHLQRRLADLGARPG
jgi:RNA polymerase sigma factor (sigma-70 family)